MIKKNNLLILILILFTLSSNAIAGKLYKWVDENGEISFSDKVPPKDSRREREQLNETGRTIAIKDAAKTPQQIKQLKQIAALQKTQETLLQTQLAQDAALLKTFRSEEDIEALAKSKLEMIDSHISIATDQSEILKKQLIRHQKAAANFERSGKAIPKKSLSNIESAQNQFSKNQHEISEFKLRKAQLAEQLANDKSRFSTLKTQSTETPRIHSETIPSLLLGELTCSKSYCDALWAKAVSFIDKTGATITYRSDNLILTKTPSLSKNRGVSLTKIESENHITLTLDIRCADSKGGKATCKNEKTTQLVNEFNQLSR